MHVLPSVRLGALGFLISIGALTLGSAASAAPQANVERQIEVGGSLRSYVIHVPSTWDRAKAIPVLFAFHGAGSSPEDLIRGAGFDALADQKPMLVVYPRAPRNVGRFDVDPPAGRVSADVMLVDALLERLRGRFLLDERRIFAVGFSNGAAFCYRLAAERPQVIAAISPCAGYLPTLTRSTSAIPVPLLHVHGAADDRVSGPGLLADPESPVAVWARWNGCTHGPDVSPVADLGRLTAKRAAYTGPTSRSDAQLVLIDGVGHTWAGGPGGAVTVLVRDFLFSHPKDEPAPPKEPLPK